MRARVERIAEYERRCGACLPSMREAAVSLEAWRERFGDEAEELLLGSGIGRRQGVSDGVAACGAFEVVMMRDQVGFASGGISVPREPRCQQDQLSQ